jgi:hypothetical protein
MKGPSGTKGKSKEKSLLEKTQMGSVSWQEIPSTAKNGSSMVKAIPKSAVNVWEVVSFVAIVIVVFLPCSLKNSLVFST